MRADAGSAAELFNRLYSRYDAWYERNSIIYEDELEALRALGLSGLGLEVGVGTGRFAAPLGVKLGVDVSVNMLRLAASRGLEAILAAAEGLPLRGSSLDFALFVVTLCFVEDPEGALRSAAEAVRPGGAVAACIVPRDSAWGKYYSSLEGNPFYEAAEFYTVDEVEGMVESVGLRVDLEVSTLTFGPGEEPRRERPIRARSGGFVCIRSKRPPPS